MKPPRRRALVVFISLVALLVCAGPWRAVVAAPTRVGIDEKLGQQVPLESAFYDETGQPVALKSLLGKTTILSLVYFECPGICTPLLNNLKDTLERVDLEPGKDFQVVTISFDPKDKPALAAQKRQNYLKQIQARRPFPAEAWRFLTGSTNSIAAITDAVGFRYLPVGQDFNHPGVLIVLAPDGRVMRYLQGTSFLPFDVKMAVIEATQGQPMPTVNRVLSFCFSYDPEGRKYVFATLKVAGVVTLTVLGCFVAFLWLTGRKRRLHEPH